MEFMNNTIFIIGGARSGKSTYAVDLAIKSQQKVIFLATCTYEDDEMQERIKKHQGSRPDSWEIITEGKNITEVIERIQNSTTTVLIDCLGMWVFNLMEIYPKDEAIEEEFEKFVEMLQRANGFIIIVSNEVGCGIVPAYQSGRRFRDLIGRLNQMVARAVQEVVLMQVGLPTKLKTKGEIT